jgi:hypothetical protein
MNDKRRPASCTDVPEVRRILCEHNDCCETVAPLQAVEYRMRIVSRSNKEDDR